jgi:hypothetical protein
MRGIADARGQPQSSRRCNALRTDETKRPIDMVCIARVIVEKWCSGPKLRVDRQ